MFLADLHAFDRFKVLSINTGRETGRRLSDMGFTKHSEGVVMRCSFLRGPMHVCVAGYHILVRHSEAAAVEVELLERRERQAGRGRWRHGARRRAACQGCDEAGQVATAANAAVKDASNEV